jgi:PAS domain-containing protein
MVKARTPRAELWLRVRNLLRLKELGDLLEHHRGTLEAEVAARTVELREAFEAARSMIESSLDALVAIGPEGLITEANEATVKATGIPRAELIGTRSRSVSSSRRRPTRSTSLSLRRARRRTTR